MSEIIDPSLDYSTKISNHSTINLRNVAPQGSQSIVLNNTGSVGPSEFIIPPQVFNPAKSRIEFTQHIETTAAKYNIVDGNGRARLARITVYDSGTNSLIVDINNQDKVAECMVYAHPKETLKTKPYFKNQTPATTSANSRKKPVEGLMRSNTATAANNLLFGAGTAGTGADALVSVGDEEPFNGLRHTHVNGTAGDDLYIDFSIPLSEMKETFLATDSMLYSPTNLVVQLYWAPLNNYAVQSDAAAALTNPTGVASGTITNLNLVCAIESNPGIISDVIGKVMSGGITYNIPYTSVVKQSLASSRAHNFSLQLTRAYGQRLLFIATAKFSNTATQINNHALGNITRYQTTLNSMPLKIPQGYDIANGDEYVLGNKAYVEGSVIESDTLFRHKFVHFDSFFGEKPLHTVDFRAVDGLDLGAQSSLFGWEATLGANTAADYYVIICGQKSLTFSSIGATIV